MKPDNLLDAFGLIDDRFVTPEQTPQVIPWRRKLTVLIAAVLIMALCVGTAMAVREDFRSFVFSIFRIDTPDQPPAAEATHPTEPGLHEMDTVNIGGAVNAYYFSSGGYVAVHEGGFYTSQWTTPDDPAFWEITQGGIVEVPSTRVDFPLTHHGKTFRIRFDYAVLNGQLAIQVWPEGLEEDPVGNGWNAEPIGDRTDAALLTIPVLSGSDYSHDLFLLDLATQETRALITDTTRNGVIAYGYQVTADLRYGIVTGVDQQTGEYGYWLYDLQADTMTRTAEAYFLNDDTIILRENLDGDHFDLVRWHIPTGVRHIIEENATGKSGYYGRHGLMFREDGSIDLTDFRTLETLTLTGLSPKNLTCAESPDGSRIMLAYEEENGFTSLGILDPKTGVLKLLDRAVSGGSETFRGWLDNDTLVITAHDIPNAQMNFVPGDGYYVYIYRFAEPEDDAFVQVRDYIQDMAVDLRYATENNFTGQVIYDFPEPWLRYGTVKKLMQVQAELNQNGLGLKLWDGFRPVSAQFRLWEVCPDARYVADPNKGFSSHSRGNTVDVTLVDADGTELPMPTGFDDFSAMADRDYSDCDPEAAANARYLEEVMVKYGFTPYSGEWWHFTDTESYPVEEAFQP